MALFGSSRKVEIDIVANDNTSNVLDKVAHGMTSMAGKVNSSIESMNSGLHRYNNAMSTLYRSTQVAVAGSGYLLYKFTKDSIQEFADFERQHAKTMGAIASNYDKTADAQKKFLDDQKKLKEESLKLGTTGPTDKGSLYSPSQVSYSQTALSKAGVKPDEISGVLPQIIKFAGGNDINLDTAADYAVNLGTMFDIPKKDWGKMLDQVTRAADISTIDVPDIFESMKYAGGIAGATKRPFDEILSMITIMGNSGLKGSMAGTGIQAFLTRLLAPTIPMKNTLEAAPSAKVIKELSQFQKDTTDSNGKFKDAATVTGMLDKVMEGLNDREQAWFSKQLFGMFQMKAGFTLAKSGGDTFKDLQNDIITNAPGTNDRKWDIMLESSYGKQTALKNAFEGTKTDVGYRLSPFTNSVYDEAFNLLNGKGNYKINFDSLNKGLEEASKMMSDQYGPQIGDFVRGVGKIGLGGSRVAMANEPLLEGAGVSVTKLLSGDIPGAFKALQESVGKTNDKIKGLPPDLQDLAKQVRNAAIALGALSAINFGARLLENLSTLWKYTIGKIVTPTMTVTATTVILKDTGILDANGKPIYKQDTVTTKETTPPVTKNGGNNKSGGSGTTGGGSVILDKDGKPISSKNAPSASETTIVDANGKKLDSSKVLKQDSTIVDEKGNTTRKSTVEPPPVATGAGGLKKMLTNGGKIANSASWMYAIGEMFGINDKILDSVGAKEGTKSRDVIDGGRTALNYGLMASFADDVILGGVLKRGLSKGATSLGKGILNAPNALNTIRGINPLAYVGELGGQSALAQSGSVVGSGPLAGITTGGIVAGAAPFAVLTGAMLTLADAYKKNKEGEANRKLIEDALKENRQVYWTNDGSPVAGYTASEQQQRLNDAKYAFRGTVGGDGTAIRQAAPNRFLHPIQYSQWQQQQTQINAKDSHDKAVWTWAQNQFQNITGQKLPWDSFAKNQAQWEEAFKTNTQALINPLMALNTALGTNTNAVSTGNVNTVTTINGKVSEVGAKVDQVNENTLAMKSVIYTGNKSPSSQSLLPPSPLNMTKDKDGNVQTLQEYIASFSKGLGGNTETNTKLESLNQSIIGVKDGQTPISSTLMSMYGVVPTNSDVNSRLDSVNANLQTLQNQPPPIVTVQAPTVNVDVKVDKEGNVQKNQYIVDSNPLDKLFQQYDRRIGK